MKFFSIETCRKLQEIECTSWSGHSWGITRKSGIPIASTMPEYVILGPGSDILLMRTHSKMSLAVLAFNIADFLSDEPYALENCKKLFRDNSVKECRLCWDHDFGDQFTGGVHVGKNIPLYQIRRHQLLQSPNQEAFILKALEVGDE